jgi:hypothetical protein
MEGHQEVDLKKSFDDYNTALWLLSFALIFKVDDGTFAALLECIGRPGQDALLERLIGTRIPGRPATSQLLWPNPYETLLKAIDASGAEQAKLMEKFLKTWYAAMGKLGAYWYDTHKKKDGGFLGYWSIEAAGVVSAFGIDDQPFRNMPYYPKDLVSN